MSEQHEAGRVTVEGGCLCGAVRWRADGIPRGLTICHCATGRRASGAPIVAWTGFAADSFTFTRGAPTIYASSPRSGTRILRSVRHTIRQDAADSVDVTTASMDDPEAIPPQDQPGSKAGFHGSNWRTNCRRTVGFVPAESICVL